MNTTSFFALFVSLQLFAAIPIAKVNDQVLTAEDWLKGDKKDPKAVEEAVSYHLIVEEAKKLNLDKNETVQKEMRKLLYQEFITTKLKEQGAQLKPTETDLRAAAEKSPLFKVRHLVVFARNKKEQRTARRVDEKIRTRLKKGESFPSLILKYSQDASARSAGNLDFRGPHNFPESFYAVVSKLKANQVSKPLTEKGAVHYFQWTEKKPFEKLPQNYLNYLTAQLQQEKQKALLTQVMADLKKNAKVEILPVTTTP